MEINDRQKGGYRSERACRVGRARRGCIFHCCWFVLLFGAQHFCLERGEIEEPEDYDAVELDFRMHGDILVSPRTASSS